MQKITHPLIRYQLRLKCSLPNFFLKLIEGERLHCRSICKSHYIVCHTVCPLMSRARCWIDLNVNVIYKNHDPIMPILLSTRKFVVRFTKCLSWDQTALWMVQSVCPSACHTFLTMFPSSYHHEIFKSYSQWQMWCQCKMSISEVNGQGRRGQKII